MDPRTHIPTDKANPIITLRVVAPVAPVRRVPNPSGAMDTELLFGEDFTVHKLSRGWVWGQAVSPIKGSDFPGYVGYIREKHLTETTVDPSHIVSCLSAPVFQRPDIKSPVISALPMNARLYGSLVGNFLSVQDGYIHNRHFRAIETNTETDFVSVAERLIGRPYIWGGVSARGLDCSGLVVTALRACGRDAPRDSDMQAEIGSPVQCDETLSGLKRGDLVFWKGHVGIMQSATHLLHANAHHMTVACEPLKMAVDRIGKSSGPITAIRRLKA